MCQCSSRLFQSLHRRIQQCLPPGRKYPVLREAHPVCTLLLPIPERLLPQHLTHLLYGTLPFHFPVLLRFPALFRLLSRTLLLFQTHLPIPTASLLPQRGWILVIQPPVYIPAHHSRVRRIRHPKIPRPLPALCKRILLRYPSHRDNLQNVHHRIQLY